jgi:sugar-specific transcriptional regulator TrmB
MDITILEDLGLSKNEIAVFISLLKSGESKAGEIISSTKLQSSAVYNAINSLIERGLVSYIKKSQIKYYRAAEPEVMLEYINTKKREYEKMLPELKALQSRETGEGVEFFKSYKGIKTLLFELLKDAKKGDIYRFFSIEDSEEYKKAVERVFRSEKQLRLEKKIMSKGIFSEKIRNIVKASSITKKRFLNFPMPPNTSIFRDKVAIVNWKGDEPSGILIHSQEIADSYAKFFEHMWEKARE